MGFNKKAYKLAQISESPLDGPQDQQGEFGSQDWVQNPPLFQSAVGYSMTDEQGQEVPSVQTWLDSLAQDENREEIKFDFLSRIPNPSMEHSTDELIDAYIALGESEHPDAKEDQKEIAVKLFNIFEKNNMARDPEKAVEEEVKEERSEELPKYEQVVEDIHEREPMKAFNLKKFTKTAVRMSEPYILNGPDEKRWCPKIRNVISDYVCRWHCLDGLALDDYRIICAETLFRQNVIDKFSREYRDKDGNYVGGYFNKRFEVHYDTAGNSYQLKPGQRRRPISPDEWSYEKRLSNMRDKLSEEREYLGGAPEPDKKVVGSGKKEIKTAGKIISAMKQVFLNPEVSASNGLVKKAQAVAQEQISQDMASYGDFMAAQGYNLDELGAMTHDEAWIQGVHPMQIMTSSPEFDVTHETLQAIQTDTPADMVDMADVQKLMDQMPITEDIDLPESNGPIGIGDEFEENEDDSVEERVEDFVEYPGKSASLDGGVFYKDGVWRSVVAGKMHFHDSEDEAITHFAKYVPEHYEDEEEFLHETGADEDVEHEFPDQEQQQ